MPSLQDQASPPPPLPKPPDWLWKVAVGLLLALAAILFVAVGWPALWLALAAAVFGAGVVVGYKGARNADFERIVGRWLE